MVVQIKEPAPPGFALCVLVEMMSKTCLVGAESSMMVVFTPKWTVGAA